MKEESKLIDFFDPYFELSNSESWGIFYKVKFIGKSRYYLGFDDRRNRDEILNLRKIILNNGYAILITFFEKDLGLCTVMERNHKYRIFETGFTLFDERVEYNRGNDTFHSLIKSEFSFYSHKKNFNDLKKIINDPQNNPLFNKYTNYIEKEDEEDSNDS